jgi:VanZ family protein
LIRHVSSLHSGSSPESSGRPTPQWQRWLFDYAPPLLLMLIIFMASTDVGSSVHSGRALHHVLTWLGLAERMSTARFDEINHYVRKAGHLTEYALLAVLIHRALNSTRMSAGRGRSRWATRWVLTSLGLVILYAASDELHQRFVASRTSSVWDVLLDTLGGAVGLALKWAWEGRWRRRRSG